MGHPDLTRDGHWMAEVLACGRSAALSRCSAGALYAMGEWERVTSISVPPERDVRRPGLRIHRVDLPARDVTTHRGIPVTTPARTLIDLVTELPLPRLERAVNQADKLDLIDPVSLRAELERRSGQRGVPALRELLDRDAFILTESELERRFVPIALRAGLEQPETAVKLHGFVVDFHWPDLGLVVETDGLRYHRTAIEQARDRRRDQVMAAAGLIPLRFTFRQVVDDAPGVERTLRRVAEERRRTTS